MIDESLINEVKDLIRYKNDYPKKGVTFIDFNQLYTRPELVSNIVTNMLLDYYSQHVMAILAPEARGFLLGSQIACDIIPFIPIRKQGKLPDFGELIRVEFDTEYSTDALELDGSLLRRVVDMDHPINKKEKIVVVYDDVLATGGTAIACKKLINTLYPDLKVCFSFLYAIKDLKGKEKMIESGIDEKNINIFLEM